MHPHKIDTNISFRYIAKILLKPVHNRRVPHRALLLSPWHFGLSVLVESAEQFAQEPKGLPSFKISLTQKKTTFHWMSCNIYIYLHINIYIYIRLFKNQKALFWIVKRIWWRFSIRWTSTPTAIHPRRCPCCSGACHRHRTSHHMWKWKCPFLLLVFVANSDRSPEMSGLFWGINHYCSVRNYCKRKVTILKPCIVLLGIQAIEFYLVGCPVELQYNRSKWWDTWTRKSRLVSGNRYHPPPPHAELSPTHPPKNSENVSPNWGEDEFLKRNLFPTIPKAVVCFLLKFSEKPLRSCRFWRSCQQVTHHDLMQSWAVVGKLR